MKKFLVALLLIGCLLSPSMGTGQVKITEFPEDTSPTSDDLIMTVDSPGTTPANKKVTLGNAVNEMLKAPGPIGGTTPAAGYFTDIITKGPWVDVRSFMDGASGRPTLATWVAAPTTTDVTAVVQAVVATGAKNILFPGGSYLITDTIGITLDGVHISGLGGATIIFNPVSEKILFRVYNSGEGYGPRFGSISGLALTSSNTVKKTGIKIEDVSQYVIENLRTIDYTWTGSDSIGLDIAGRDQTTIRKVMILSERPIYINANKHVGAIAFDNDVLHFEDLSLVASVAAGTTSTYPCIQVDPEATLFDVVFDGFQTWNMGTHGYYQDHTNNSDAASLSIAFNNVRWEQGVADGYGIYIKTSGNTITQVSINNYWSPAATSTGVNGIYLNKVAFASISDSYLSTAVGKVPISLTDVNHLRLSNVRDNPDAQMSFGAMVVNFGVTSVGDSGWLFALVDGSAYTPTVGSNAVLTTATGLANTGGSAGKATCWKTATTLGYCSSVVGADGTCTCN